jgi:hypothetical protein
VAEGAAVRRRWVLGAILALLWLFVVVSSCGVAHKPFAADNLVTVGRALVGLVGAAGVVALELRSFAPTVSGSFGGCSLSF